MAVQTNKQTGPYFWHGSSAASDTGLLKAYITSAVLRRCKKLAWRSLSASPSLGSKGKRQNSIVYSTTPQDQTSAGLPSYLRLIVTSTSGAAEKSVCAAPSHASCWVRQNVRQVRDPAIVAQPLRSDDLGNSVCTMLASSSSAALCHFGNQCMQAVARLGSLRSQGSPRKKEYS